MRRTRSTVITAVAAFLLLATTAACGNEEVESVDPSSPTLASRVVGTWTLESWESDGVRVTRPTEPTAVVNFLADGTLSGDTGCNRFGGSYSVDGDDLSVTTGPMTRRACADEVAATQEAALLAALPEVTSARLSESTLELLADSGTVLLTLAAGPSDLDGSAWQVAAVNNGTGGLEASALTEALTAEFREGTISGFSGCNTFSAGYTTEDDRITIEAPRATLIGCGPDVAETEARYLTALERSTRFELEATSLTLRDADGAAQVTFRPRA